MVYDYYDQHKREDNYKKGQKATDEELSLFAARKIVESLKDCEGV